MAWYPIYNRAHSNSLDKIQTWCDLVGVSQPMSVEHATVPFFVPLICSRTLSEPESALYLRIPGVMFIIVPILLGSRVPLVVPRTRTLSIAQDLSSSSPSLHGPVTADVDVEISYRRLEHCVALLLVRINSSSTLPY